MIADRSATEAPPKPSYYETLKVCFPEKADAAKQSPTYVISHEASK